MSSKFFIIYLQQFSDYCITPQGRMATVLQRRLTLNEDPATIMALLHCSSGRKSYSHSYQLGRICRFSPCPDGLERSHIYIALAVPFSTLSNQGLLACHDAVLASDNKETFLFWPVVRHLRACGRPRFPCPGTRLFPADRRHP